MSAHVSWTLSKMLTEIDKMRGLSRKRLNENTCEYQILRVSSMNSES